MSIAARVREEILSTPRGGFIDASELARALGAPGAVATAFSRLAQQGLVTRVRRGLYWRPRERARDRAASPTPRSRPDPLRAALEIAGRGAGPAGSAALEAFPAPRGRNMT